jgi:hypothetical protein
MITFTTRIQQFKENKEKTGWSYLEVSSSQAEKLNPGVKKTYRVKGFIDQHKIEKVALMPLGEGKFILPMNASMRKGTGKKTGDQVKVQLEMDAREIKPPSDFIKCLKDEPKALEFFESLPKGHQNYFSNWISSAKTIETKTKRITMALIALATGQGFGEMIRANKSKQF